MINLRPAVSRLAKDLYDIKPVRPKPTVAPPPCIARLSQIRHLAAVYAAQPAFSDSVPYMLLNLHKHHRIRLLVVCDDIYLKAAVEWTWARVAINDYIAFQPKHLDCDILAPLSMRYTYIDIRRLLP
jgi:hypothetical protein